MVISFESYVTNSLSSLGVDIGVARALYSLERSCEEEADKVEEPRACGVTQSVRFRRTCGLILVT